MWSVSGIVFSISIPPGLGIQVENNEVVWDVPVYNESAVYEDFSSCAIHFSGELFSASETATANYQFGSHFYLEGPASDGASI